LAVTVISADELENSRGIGLDEALRSVPGVLAQSRYGNQDVRISIRGFGVRGAGDRSNAGTSRGIRVIMDGIPETEPDGRTSFDLVDLGLAQRIEIIRSNASALWGNASGGIVNISTVPRISSSFVSGQTLFGSFGFKKYVAQTGTPLGDGKIYASAIHTEGDGWRDHSGFRRELFNVGLSTPLGLKTLLGISVFGTSNYFNIPGPLSKAEFDENPQAANATYQRRDEHRFNRSARIGLTLDHEIDDVHSLAGMMFLNPKYLQRSERGTFRDFTRYHLGGNLVYKNHLDFDTFKSRFIAGIDNQYQDGAILFYRLNAQNRRSDTLTTNKGEGAVNYGFFAQEEILLGEHFSMTVGARYDDITYDYRDHINPSLDDTKSFKRITPKAGVSWLFSPLHSIYANLGGGVEAPAGNETDPIALSGVQSTLNPLLKAVISTTYEVGTKQFFDIEDGGFLKGFSYDAAAYLIQVDNDIIPYDGGKFYTNAGKTRRIGAELGLNLDVDYGVSLKTAFTFANNEYQQYTVDSSLFRENNTGKADFSGNKVAGLPQFYSNVALRYSPQFFKEIFVELEAQTIGEYFANDANTITVPGYTVFNATLGMAESLKLFGHLALKGFVNVQNLTDAKYAGSAFVNPDLVRGVPVYLEAGMPVNFTVGFTVGFE
ncbi:MAG TPA: TonB-dependent receptor, partial [Patescibacteria group bacterium]|nr:TonB-dependent receptor [Patescibacteria group bacterium]